MVWTGTAATLCRTDRRCDQWRCKNSIANHDAAVGLARDLDELGSGHVRCRRLGDAGREDDVVFEGERGVGLSEPSRPFPLTGACELHPYVDEFLVLKLRARQALVQHPEDIQERWNVLELGELEFGFGQLTFVHAGAARAADENR